MSTADFKGKFFTFNLGHLLTILIYVITGAIYVGVIKTTLNEHSKMLEKAQTELQNLKDKYYELAGAGGTVDKSQNLNIQALDLRVSRVETSLAKIDILANDFTWLKQWVLKQDEKKN